MLTNTLNVEKRNENIKAKKLKKIGMVPGIVYGGNLEETLLIQIPEGDARKLLRNKLKGGNLILDYDGKKLNVILKEIDCNPVNKEIQNLSFQNLIENEKVVSTAQIIILNKNKLPITVRQLMKEIPYRALPCDLIEKVVIDLDRKITGNSLKVEDLPIYKNPNIETLVESDRLVFNIIENSKKQQEIQIDEAV